MTQLTERDRSLVRFLIEALDDDGYLSAPLQELWETLPPEYEIELEELEIALRHIQNFDPTGIGARNLQECLSLQLRALPDDCMTRTSGCSSSTSIWNCWPPATFAKLRRVTGYDDEDLKAAQGLITSLNPRPAAGYAQVEARYITPDVIVEKLRAKWTALSIRMLPAPAHQPPVRRNPVQAAARGK